MSARLGNPQQVTIASAALGVAGGRVIPFNNTGWALLASIALLYTASATVGNRVLVVDVKDAAGNILYRATLGTAVTAGQTPRLIFGAGLATTGITTPLTQTFALPDGFAVPPAATLTLFDNANIDVADTVLGTAVLVF
jgi:hypothetical protein